MTRNKKSFTITNEDDFELKLNGIFRKIKQNILLQEGNIQTNEELKSSSSISSISKILEWEKRFAIALPILSGCFVLSAFFFAFIKQKFWILFSLITLLLSSLALFAYLFTVVIEYFLKTRERTRNFINGFKKEAKKYYSFFPKKIIFKKSIAHSEVLKYAEMCLAEQLKQIESYENKFRELLPFIALCFSVLAVLWFDIPEQNLEKKFLYGAVSGISGLVT